MFLCSFSQPEILGEVLFCLPVFSGTVVSPPALFMSLTPALSGEKGHYCLKFCPCSQTHCLGGAPTSGRKLGSLAQSIYFRPRPAQLPRPARPGGGGWWGWESAPFCLPFQYHAPQHLWSSSSAFPYSSFRQTVESLSLAPDKLHQASRPQVSFLSNIPLNSILR